MFDVDALVADIQASLDEAEPRRAVREVLSRAMASRAEIARTLRPDQGRITTLHRADDLTVLELVWPPGMQLYPHDHNTWACIGIYAGREDNAFYRRDGRGLVASGGKELHEGDVTLLGDDTIHSVHNPLRQATAAIHVYGGDFFAIPRSQWCDPERLEEPYDTELLRQRFADANEQWRSAAGTGPR